MLKLLQLNKNFAEFCKLNPPCVGGQLYMKGTTKVFKTRTTEFIKYN